MATTVSTSFLSTAGPGVILVNNLRLYCEANLHRPTAVNMWFHSVDTAPQPHALNQLSKQASQQMQVIPQPCPEGFPSQWS